jgi:hypothetical protein
MATEYKVKVSITYGETIDDTEIIEAVLTIDHYHGPITSMWDFAKVSIPLMQFGTIGRIWRHRECQTDILQDYGDFVHRVLTECSDKVMAHIGEYIDLRTLHLDVLELLIDECGHEWWADNSEWWAEYEKDIVIKAQSNLNLMRDIVNAARNQHAGQRAINGKPGYVYLLKSVSGHWKIGRSGNPNNRLKTFGIQLPFEVEFEHLIQTCDMSKSEATLHAQFASKRVNGEWFNLSPDDVAYIKSIVSM